MTNNAPIGIFDSGVGGLTVARAIRDLLPNEELCYVGDTARVPYGPLPIAVARQYALETMDHLVSLGVKMLVIACNTASAACLRDARERYSVPVVEVIRPAVRRAVSVTRNGHVGVIGTAATISSQAYDDLFAAAPDVRLSSAACPAFVEFVEKGRTSGRQILGLAQAYLAPLLTDGIDTLILGCTHYPLLAGVLGATVGPQVTLVSSADETARDVERVLAHKGLQRDEISAPPQHVFLATSDPEPFRRLGRHFFGPEIDQSRVSRLDSFQSIKDIALEGPVS